METTFADLLKKHPLKDMAPTEQELFLLQLGTVVDEGIKANSFNVAALNHCQERMNRYMSQVMRLTLENGRLKRQVDELEQRLGLLNPF